MKHINFLVKISQVKATGISNTDYGYNGTEGAFYWKLKNSDLLYWKDGILLSDWCSGFSNSVDIRRFGRQATESGGSIKVSTASGLVDFLKTSGVSLIGAIIEIFEDDLVSGQKQLCKSSISEWTSDESTGVITFDGLFEIRKTNIGTSAINPEESTPLIIGNIEKTKFVLTEKEQYLYEFLQTDNMTPLTDLYFRIEDSYLDTSVTGIGTIFVLCESQKLNTYDATNISAQSIYDLQTRINDYDDVYALCFKGSGKNICKKIRNFALSGTDYYQMTLQESVFVDEMGNPEWLDKTETLDKISYISIHIFKATLSADQWTNCGGYIDPSKSFYKYLDGDYLDVSNASNLQIGDNSIEIKSGTIDNFEKISGFAMLSPSSVTSNLDVIYYDGFPFFDSIYGLTSALPIRNVGNSVLSNIITGNVSSLLNRNHDDYLQAIITQDATGGSSKLTQIYLRFAFGKKYKSLTKAFLLMDIDIAATLGVYLSGIYTNNLDRPFLNKANGSLEFLSTTGRTFLVINNFPANSLTNFIPTFDQSAGQPFLHKIIDGVYDGDLSNRVFSGHNLIEYDSEVQITNNEFFNINFCLSIGQHDIINPTMAYVLKLRCFAVAIPVDEIAFIDGLYSKWYGRNYNTTTFGSGQNTIIRKSQDVIGHLLRLKNYKNEGLTHDYSIDSFSDVLNNTTSYKGLQRSSDTCDMFFDRQVNKIEHLDVDKMIDGCLKDSWSFLYRNSLGIENLVYLLDIARSATRVSIDYSDIIDGSIGNIKDTKTSDIFCNLKVNYAWDDGLQKYTKSISITNTDSPVFDYDYVKSTSNLGLFIPIEVWGLGKALRNKYKVDNEAPIQISNCDWIQEDATAINFLRSWYSWQGSTSAGIVVYKELTFSVPYEFAIDNNLELGSLISLSLPHLQYISNTINGMITKTNFSLNANSEKCTITVILALDAETGETGDIIETGSSVDNIVETGANVNQIIEDGI